MEKKKRGYIFQVIFLILLIGFGVWREQTREQLVHKSAFLMDTLVEVETAGLSDSLAAYLDEAFVLARDYQDQLSYYDTLSALSQINASEADSTLLSMPMMELLQWGREYWQLTGGRYDLSMGRLAEIWDFDKQELPSKKAVEEALQHTGMEKVKLRDGYLFKPAGVKLNLGSIAKGYIVDQIADYLQKRGASSGLINAGGDLRFWGMGEVSIGIQHPRRQRGEVISTLILADKAVVTSGDYERSFWVDGKRYHHIIDALSGYPADTCVSVTIIADLAVEADGLSTAAFVLPPKEAVEMINSIEGAEAIIYYQKSDGSLDKMLTRGADKYLERE